jgi:hypothetical protein
MLISYLWHKHLCVGKLIFSDNLYPELILKGQLKYPISPQLEALFGSCLEATSGFAAYLQTFALLSGERLCPSSGAVSICAVSNHLLQDPNCFTTLKSEIREAKRVNSKVLLRWT